MLPALAEQVGAESVHVTGETTPKGRERDARVAEALGRDGVGWVATGSPYAVTPGRVRNRSGQGYRVFGPFERAWRAHGWPGPAGEPNDLRLLDAPAEGPQIRQEIEDILAATGDTLKDLHVWQVGPGHFAAIISVASATPQPAQHYKALLLPVHELSHVTVEVQAL